MSEHESQGNLALTARAAPGLHNIAIERDMPSGYTWVKFRDCWTDDLTDARFMAPKMNQATQEEMPAAFFCAIITYDPVAGWISRDVKFQGRDAVAMLMFKEESYIIRLNADGHLVTKSYQASEGVVRARSTVFIKEGTTEVLEQTKQSPREPAGNSLEAMANRLRPQSEPAPAAPASDVEPPHFREIDLADSLTQPSLTTLARSVSDATYDADGEPMSIWPSGPAYDATDNMDEAPW